VKRSFLFDLGAVGMLLLISAAAISAQSIELHAPTNEVWKSDASLGLTVTRGNSDTLLFAVTEQTQRKTATHEISFGGDAGYGEDKNVENKETLHGYGQFNHLFPHQFYGYARLDGLHDGIANLAYRFTAGPGVGYYFIKDKQTSLSAEIGTGFDFEKLGGKRDYYSTFRVADKFERKLNQNVRIWENCEILPQTDNPDNFKVNSEIGVESALTKKAGLRVYLQDAYNSVPAVGRVNNDLKLVSALSWKF